MLGVQIAHRLGLGLRSTEADIDDQLFVDMGAAQEAGFVVIVVFDHFQHQGADFVLMAHQRK